MQTLQWSSGAQRSPAEPAGDSNHHHESPHLRDLSYPRLLPQSNGFSDTALGARDLPSKAAAQPRLGVTTVIVQGGQVPEYHIVPDMARMQNAGVTILDIANAVQTSNIIDSPGLYEANHQLILGLVGAQAHDAVQLGSLVVKTTPAAHPCGSADVAAVEHRVLPVYTTVTANGLPAVLLNIARQPTSNTVTVADGVAAQVHNSRRRSSGVHLEPYYDQSELVRETIPSVRDAILIGLVLACVILFLFLGNWSTSLVAGLAIPVTVAVTVLFLLVIGETFNLMTLGGLAAAIGLVIDDAIVVVENIVLHRDAGETRAKAARLALREMSAPSSFPPSLRSLCFFR